MRKTAIAVSIALLALFVVILPISDARAQMRPFYVGIFGGYTIPEEMKVDSATVGPYNIDLENGGLLGAKFGYIPPGARFLALEVELNGMWNDYDRQVVLPSISGTEQGDASLVNFMFNARFRYPEGRLHPYVGFGIGWSTVYLEGTETYVDAGRYYVRAYEDDDTSFAWQFLAGVTYDINPAMDLEFGYRYFWTEPQFPISDVEFKSHIITFGVNFHF